MGSSLQDKRRTPFNVGVAIELVGFQIHEAQPLAQGLAFTADNPCAVLQAVLDWTGGQPFLTQKICHLILTTDALIPQGAEAQWVEQLVQLRIIENWESFDEPEHLKTIRDRLLRSGGQRTGRLLGLYQKIIQQGEIAANDSPEQMELRLTGLVVRHEGKLRVYNHIYGMVFNQEWLDKALAELRPYAELLNAWVASSFQDESRLLRGEALQEAQEWAAGKSLSDLDYQFLAASQEVDKLEVKRLLQAEEQARLLLAEVNRQAKRRIRIGSVLLGVSVVGVVGSGIFAASSIQEVEFSREIIQLERSGYANVARADIDPAEVLVVALRDGDKLKTLLKKKNWTNENELPAPNPVLALQVLLNKVGWQRQVLKGHQSSVNSASFSPDGQRILTASTDKTAKIWDLNGQLIATLQGHQSSVNSASFSPDGKHILTASTDKTAKIWDLNGQPIATLQSHQSSVNSASFSPDGKRILTASGDNTAKIWDLNGQPIATLQGHHSEVNSARFSPDGQRILTASGDKTAKIWDLNGQPIVTLQGHQSKVNSASFSSDGKRILTASGDKTAKIWDLNGQPIVTLQGHHSEVISASFSPDGKRILTASWDKTAKIWDLNGQLIATLQGHQSKVNSASFSPDSKHIVTASSDKTAKIWKVKNFKQLLTEGCEWLQGYLLDEDKKKNIIIPKVCDDTPRSNS